MLFNVYLCNHIILLRSGGGTWDTVLYTVGGVRGLGIRMLTFDTKTSLYIEDRGLQVPMTLEHDTPLKSWPESYEVDLDSHVAVYPIGPHWIFQVDIKTLQCLRLKSLTH